MNPKKLQRNSITPTLAILAISLLLVNPERAHSQSQRPISKEGLFKAVQIGGLSNQELSSYVSSLGVDFKLSDDERSNLLKSGLERSVVEAIANNYRAPELPKPTAAELEAAQVAQLSTGGPLTQDDLVNHLKGGVGPAILEKIVEKRGIAFTLSQDSAKTIEMAGGNRSLLGVLLLRQLPPSEEIKPQPQLVLPTLQLSAVAPPAIRPIPQVEIKPPVQSITKSIIQATLLKREDTMYPALAKREKISGTVRCEVNIDDKGLVTKVKALSGHPVLTAAAEDSIRRWKYTPAKLDGKPVQSSTIVEVNFKPIN